MALDNKSLSPTDFQKKHVIGIISVALYSFDKKIYLQLLS